MNVEENRLGTFAEWPANAAVDASRIARAGFYYVGRGLEVQCFLCGTRISEWNYGDQAMARHRRAAPSCPFVVDSAGTCNVPLVSSSSSLSSSSSSTSSSSSPQSVPVNGAVEPPTTSSSAANDVVVVTRQPNVVVESDHPPTGNAIHELVVRSADPLRDYGTVSQRLRSFDGWPIPSVVSPERLAKAGFYYLQYSDMVECAYCRGFITRWKAGDDPDNEHRLHFPNCDFYMRQETEDDVLELANVTLMPGTSANLTELGIQAHKAPCNLKNTIYEERLRTFVGWPVDYKQTPEMLATAGFYYTGTDDQVRCFHCDGGLRNWEPTDDVWFEHARWFPKCIFINLVRGQEFIKHCIDNRPPLDPKIFDGIPDEDGDVIEISNLSASLPTTPQTRTPPVTDAEIVRLLDTAPALAALEIGLSVDRVKRALRRRLEEYGVPYTEAEELIEDVLYDQTLEEYSNTPDSSSPGSINSTDQVVKTTNNFASLLNEAEDSVYSEIKKDDENVVCNIKEEETDVSNKESKLEEKKTDNESNIMLQEENRRLKEARLCKICMDDEVAVVFLPCGHLATCVYCAPPLTCCPMCRVKIRASVRTFLS